jgi:hypothetical protein
MIEFPPLTRANCQVLALLEGATLSRVAYCLHSDDESPYAGGEAGVDHLLPAVDLDFGAHGAVSVTWATLGNVEALAVVPAPYFTGVEHVVLDASDREAWRNHIGRTVVSVATAWHTSNDGYPESIWSVRLTFDTGSVVIALGELSRSSQLDYMPNEIVVVFDESLARAYHPHHVTESSWGSPIPR